MTKQKYPEPTVGALIINPEGNLFLMRSHKWKDKWVIPGGHIELGETIEEAVTREVHEETNLEVFDIEFLCFQEFIYDHNFWKKRHYIFFDFVCKTNSYHVNLNHEAQEYSWVPPNEALEFPIDPYTKKVIMEYLNKINHL